MTRLTVFLFCATACLGACRVDTYGPVDLGGATVAMDAGGDARVTCLPCVQSSDCGGSAECVQYGNDDYCGVNCTDDDDCNPDESCRPAATFDGAELLVCIPNGGGCVGAGGCGTCPAPLSCDVITGHCLPTPPDAGVGTTPCGNYDPPSSTTCCKSCAPSDDKCQANGCYGGWWCDSPNCRCHAPPTTCGASPLDAGLAADLAGVDFGGPLPPITGTVGNGGGTVSRLYFAVIGDTRPANEDDTANYPVAVIEKIYADIEAMSPRPQFVISTGDYVFANPANQQAAPQMARYAAAAKQFSGPTFAAMGNHECTGYTSGNCATQPTNNYAAFLSTLLAPLGQSKPYYAIPINGLNGSFTAKLIVTACNAWDATQQGWLIGELAKATNYTFIVRHEPTGTTQAPCAADMDPLLAKATYDLLIVGHTHTFSHDGHEVVVGNGGAPLTGNVDYGYATVEQRGGAFLVTEYEYSTAMPVAAFMVP